ncbi:hypothetical protein JZO66_07495 [Enterococcus sp. DIV0242_7C1]|uniref:Uncharacterized protein n=2 Tax=Enterococcus TaxID=1350 RepID=A0A200J113_9ENTE|nr:MULTISPECIES: hypothetical protein [unclassified Enterococcus]MBO0470386.1 hypothetical protein [Enterococcus sp. DIV0242_7C1]OUZ30245.1 hypothetical protein A5889_002533 [Enterococcus sp. 9D6_DIV0238]
MYRAVVVYQSTPMFGRNKLPDGNILGMFKQNKLVKELNRELQKRAAPWTVVLDDSIADIHQISQNAEAILCVPGLQKQFDSGDYSKERIFYFDSLDYHNVIVTSAIAFLETIHS